MIVRFSTRHGHLVMQGEPALALLRLAGHSGTVPGAVLAADLPSFLTRLQQGLEAHGDEYSPAPPPTPAAPADDADDEPRDRPVKLRQRAVPLLDMIRTAITRGDDLMWERA